MNSSGILMILITFLAGSCNTSNGLEKSATESESKKTYPVEEYTSKHDLDIYSTAVFAGGCFWCTEAAFERIVGVRDVISGYAGGHKEYPEYGEVGAGGTGHAEAIYIYYDRDVIGYDELLDVFFVAHDPTTLNRQGPDIGEEYRSEIFYKTGEEKAIINNKIASVNASGMYSDSVVTVVSPYTQFWVAEDYHQNYYELHPDQSYVRNVSRPKVEKVMKTFPLMIKEKYKN